MQIASHVWRWYRAWNDNPVFQLLHWVFFVTAGLLIASHVVSAISASAIEDYGITSLRKGTVEEYAR